MKQPLGVGVLTLLGALTLLGVAGSGGSPVAAQDVRDTAFVLSEDAEWASRLRQAETWIAAGKYRLAIEVLQNAVQFHADRLIPLHDHPESPPGTAPPAPVVRDPTRSGIIHGGGSSLRAPFGNFRPRFYCSVAVRARRMLLGMPAEGREVYRQLYGGIASRQLRRGLQSPPPSGERLVTEVALNYTLTRAGTKACVRLADRYFEQGWVRRAVELWRTATGGTFDDRPEAGGLGLERAAIRLRSLVALRSLGRSKTYEHERAQLVEELERLASTAEVGSPAGRAVAFLRAEVAGLDDRAALDTPRPVTTFPVTAIVPFAGSAGAGAVIEGLPSLQEVGTYDLDWISPWWAAAGVWRPTPRMPRGRFRFGSRRWLGPGMEEPSYSFFPAVRHDEVPGGRETGEEVGGEVIVSSVFDIWKVDLRSGNLRTPRIEKQLTAELATVFKENSSSPLYVPVVDRGHLYATTISELRQKSDYLGYTIFEECPTRTLVCRDVASAEVVWHTGGFTLGTSDDPKPVSIVTPPLVVGDLVVAGGWIDTGHVDSVVVAFDRRSGKARWSTLLASNQMELTMFGEWAREPLSWCLLEDEGILYCVTGVGVCAAVEASTGNVLWLVTYETIPIDPSFGPYPIPRDLTWAPSPPVLVDGVLYAAPRDSRYFLAFDTGLRDNSRWNLLLDSGRRAAAGVSRGAATPLLWKHPPPGDVSEFLGLHRERFFFAGSGGVEALRITPGQLERAPRSVGSRIEWHKYKVLGRPAMSDRGIVFTDKTGLRLVDYDLSTIRDLVSPFPASPDGDFPGNVVLLEDRILLMSRDLLSSFVPRRPAPAVRPPEAGSRDREAF